MIEVLSFYLFAGVAVASAIMVISARNPVHSVLFLILCFFNAAALFILLGAEFLAMVLVIVYVGAVAVLFLFVVMMLDINFAEMRQGFMQYLPVGGMIGIILLVELLMVLGATHLVPEAALAAAAAPTPDVGAVDNASALGHLIYTRYVYLFQAAGLVLLVAMIGAMVLTHRTRGGVRRQKIADQVARRRANAVELKKIEPRQGI